MNEAALHHALIEKVSVGVVVWRVAAPDAIRLVAANHGAAQVARLDYCALVGRTLAESFPAAVAAGRPAAYVAAARADTDQVLASGTYPELGSGRVYGRLVPLPDRHVGVMFVDASVRDQAEDETRKLNVFLDSIIDNIPAMVFVKDAEHLRYELFNRAGEALSGFKRGDIYGKSPADLFPAEQAEFFMGKDRAVLRDGRMLDIPEEPINTPLGKRWLHTKKIPIPGPDGKPSHLLGISLDITERKAAQDELAAAHRELEQRVAERTRELHEANEQLRQAQKLEAVGRLAGGVAHDFNNLLSVILSYAALLERESPEVAPVEAAQQIRRASERAALLTRQLLAFGRQQVLAPRVLDLNETVRSMGAMLTRVIGEDVQLLVRPEPQLWRTRIDASQLEQVLMNLVVNARDAMPRGGELTVATGNVSIPASGDPSRASVPAGDWLELRVSDSGVGMDAATAARAFEPFYTTKHPGRGTGLGLSTVYGIVKQSGGHISLESAPDQGTTVRIYLPRTLEPAVNEPPAERVEASTRGNETILLVEDDEQVRKIAGQILKLAGYRVLSAGCPNEALELARGGERIHLLVTDVVLPRMNGRELAQRLREQRPELRVLYMSGYADKHLDEEGALSDAAFLQKPLTPDALTTMVRRVLDGS